MKNKEKILIKDKFFNKEKLKYLASRIKGAYPVFLSKRFIDDTHKEFGNLELKERLSHTSLMLKRYLPKDYNKAIKILLKSLPKEKITDTLDNNFGDFLFSSYGEFVSRFGCKKEYLDFSLNALEKITSIFSAEFAIREFLNKFEKETFNKMIEWSRSSNYHIRRLASEGSRPKLPWGKNINLDYRKTIKILDNLYVDNSRYVTRSVANHLNDISKIDSLLVIDILYRWEKTISFLDNIELNKKNDLKYIIKHSTRSLVKLGDKKTLKFLGYQVNPNIKIKDFKLKNRNINIGENLEFNLKLGMKESEKLIIDYKIHFPLKNGKLSEKVFKIKRFKGKKGDILDINKKHPLKIMTTKKLLTGTHYLGIQINGTSYLKEKFYLQV